MRSGLIRRKYSLLIPVIHFLMDHGDFSFPAPNHHYRNRCGMASANGYMEKYGLASSITRLTEGLWINLSK